MTDVKNGTGEEKQEFSLISNDTLLALYRGLLRSRANAAPRTLKSGWDFDAAAVAVGQDLNADDSVFAEGGADVLRKFSVNGRSRKDTAPAFSQELHRAIGSALAQRTKKTGRVTVVFGGQEHGESWTDALEIARAHRLPIIFIAKAGEDASPTARPPRKAKSGDLEPGTEMARIIVDGHDVVGSYRVAHEAITRARKDRGPTLIECAEFRVPGQRRQDAITAMEGYLRGKGLLERGTKQEILAQLAQHSRPRQR